MVWKNAPKKDLEIENHRWTLIGECYWYSLGYRVIGSTENGPFLEFHAEFKFINFFWSSCNSNESAFWSCPYQNHWRLMHSLFKNFFDKWYDHLSVVWNLTSWKCVVFTSSAEDWNQDLTHQASTLPLSYMLSPWGLCFPLYSLTG